MVRRRLLGWLACGIAVACAVACGAFSGTSGDDEPTSSDAGNDVTAPTQGDGNVPSVDAGTPNADDGGLSCASTTETFSAIADGLIARLNAQPLGNLSVCNVNTGACLFQFKLTGTAASALSSGVNVVARLTTTRPVQDPNCSNGLDGAGDCTTASFDDNTQLTLWALTSNWNENQMGWYDRATNMPWADAGANGADRSATPVSTLAVMKSDPSNAFPIDVTKTSSWVTNGLVSFIVQSSSAGYVVVSHEATDASTSPATPAMLTVIYCTAADD